MASDELGTHARCELPDETRRRQQSLADSANARRFW
jgi:hypothetical protein